MQYLICGFMGAGKTHSLSLLEDIKQFHGYHFADLDKCIIDSHSEFSSIAELIESRGLGEFRSIESYCLNELLMNYPNLWVSLGGGTLLEGTGGAKVYWLNTDFETCWDRIKYDTTRPLAKSYETAKALFNSRLNAYRAHPVFRIESFL